MQVFKTYFKILRKQLPSLLTYGIGFLVLTFIININIKDGQEKYERSLVRTMVINEDGESSLIDGFLKYMEDYIIFVEPEVDETARKDALFYNRAVYILTIPEGFTESFLNNGTVLLEKQTILDSIEIVTVDDAIEHYFNMAAIYLKNIPDIDYKELNKYIEASLQQDTPLRFHREVKKDQNNFNIVNQYFFNYLGYIIIGAFVSGISIVMFSFQGIDIRRKHAASPITQKKMSVQLIAANIIFAVVYIIVFIIASLLLNKPKINGNTLLFWVNLLILGMTALSFSYLVGITVKSRKAIAAISTGVSLSLAFVSGMFVPQDFLGAPVLRVASFTPTYWYVKANNILGSISELHKSDLSDIMICMGIEIGFSIAILSIALVIHKRKQQQAY